ncbi:Crp/Fnr family transcriptional regulator [Microvirga sesbaniae]|uniref:Crp/Fnr family transcriptional regulator n=1 Tax=Microvirga sesbaniae TaxID=681392 RepID=UPI0021C88057|nr:Crp/Fnr family transcriptional regulator [Microvirga sp. HBU67692]
MATHLIRKLEQFTTLSSTDKEALARLAALRVRRLDPREDITREGDRPGQVYLILEGWTCRYKVLEDGRRQITAFLVPGDICGLHMFILKQMDHSMGAVTPLTIAEIPSDTVLELTDASPHISRALWWTSLVEEATAREWITNLGQREALERLAHLFCELFLRLRVVGLANGEAGGASFELPVTQEQLAEATGVSTVHVNRTLQQMREQGLIVWKGKTLIIPDVEVLQEVALFNPNYLHLNHSGESLPGDEIP